MYNKRLKITQEDYTGLLDAFNWMLSQDTFTRENQIERYFQIATEKNYSKTRMVFDFYHALLSRYTQENNKELYLYVRSLNYLNDNTLESALHAVLSDTIIGANFLNRK